MNRLQYEKSPYLLQHQSNPVDWYAWGEAAFAKAREKQMPIFLSIGYSTCHWCHVMEHESFENPAIAALLNEHFVSIKVDREERPDIDQIYMTYVQATTGSGGWPMTVFLTPALTPFFGGTYFPPEDRWGKPGFSTLLRRIAEAWRVDRPRIEAHGEETLTMLRAYAATPGSEENAPAFTDETLRFAVGQIAHQYEPEEGGFSNAPKFPRPVTLHFLLRMHARAPHTAEGEQARDMTLFTLRKMADGGLYDHLGGGFHRYSVDRFWHIPHFEKMLYDQGQLASIYLDAFQRTRDPFYANVARGTLDYILRDMTSPEGAFYSAEDADSLVANGSGEKSEGAFYVWTQAEIEALLPAEDAALFCRAYGVEPMGNAPEGSDPHQEFVGKNTLIRRFTDEELAAALHQPVEEITASLSRSRAVLLEARSARHRPHLDDKIITAWNGLTLSALARAAQVLGEPRYAQAAERAATFLHDHLRTPSGELLRSYREGASAIPGFASDYAFLVQGLLDLYEATGAIRWLQWAVELQETQERLFAAPDGGYFSTTGADPSVLVRMREDYDGAEPAPASVAALNTLRLGQLLHDPRWTARGEATLRAFSTQIVKMPAAAPQLLTAVEQSLGRPHQLVIAGNPVDAEPILREIHADFLPHKALLFADGGAGQRWLGERIPALNAMQPIHGEPALYLCRDFTCKAPVTTPEAVRALLRDEL